MTAASHQRQTAGIDPDKLLVLSFIFENVDERNLLEKLGLQVVQEREIRISKDNASYTSMLTFSTEQQMRSFAAQSQSHKINKITSIIESSGGIKIRANLRSALLITIAQKFLRKRSLATSGSEDNKTLNKEV